MVINLIASVLRKVVLGTPFGEGRKSRPALAIQRNVCALALSVYLLKVACVFLALPTVFTARYGTDFMRQLLFLWCPGFLHALDGRHASKLSAADTMLDSPHLFCVR